MNFILSESTFLRYFCPIVIEGNKRNIKSNFFIKANGKYNNCFKQKNLEEIQKFCKNNNVSLYNLNTINNFNGVTFVIEGCEAQHVDKNKHTIISITYQSDFTCSLDNYKHNVDYIMMPSEFIAKYYKMNSNKDLYFGSPKYDYISTKQDVFQRYSLNKNDRYCLVIFPKNRDIGKVDIKNIYEKIRGLGYKLLVKTRGKDPITVNDYRGDHYFEDEYWFPHTTMDLIKISDFVVNFESTAIKECVLLQKPILNFKCKPFNKPFDFLYNYDYCINIDDSTQDFSKSLELILSRDSSAEFDKAIRQHLFQPGTSSSQILDFIEQKKLKKM